jgi:aromatic ring-cleaving dioxygenase
VTALWDAAEIRGYHAHVYFDLDRRDVAVSLREAIAARFQVELGRVLDYPYGPHPQPMYEVKFGVDELPKILPWLMLNRAGLNVMVHPSTDDPIADHTTRPIWLGAPVALDLDFIRRYIESRRRQTSE